MSSRVLLNNRFRRKVSNYTSCDKNFVFSCLFYEFEEKKHLKGLEKQDNSLLFIEMVENVSNYPAIACKNIQ